MRSYLILVLFFFLSLVQGAFLPLNLVLVGVLVWAVLRPIKETLIVAFLAGVFLDLALGTPLGLSSLVFLTSSYLLALYARKFDPLYPLFLPAFSFLSFLAYSLVVSGYPDWREGLVLAFLAFLIRPLVKYFSPLGFEKGGIRLKV
ncbi:MAG TPA: rod shape-determining protein MreD [Candidatus Bathyarchaeia archaeon]|nr:rod shape-determining protein MreD [Candidatus Bathyarchaeia archaeon]